MRKGKLYIGWNSIVFVSPITGNGFSGGYWWSIKAFFRLFPCLVWVGSPLYQLLFVKYKRSLGKRHGQILSVHRGFTYVGTKAIRPYGYIPLIKPFEGNLSVSWLWWTVVFNEIEAKNVQ